MSTPQEPQYRQRVGYQAMLLGGFSTLATAFLVAGNIATKDAILERQQEDLQDSLSQVIPADQYNNNLLENPLQLSGPQGKPLTVYRGTEGMQISALAWEVSSQGYAGKIRLILGLDADGSILGVRVLSHAETPGLGDKIEVEKDDWMLTFNGLSLNNPSKEHWGVKKDGGRFDQFSGATITPRAVVQAIKGGLRFFQERRTELLNPPVITTATVDPE
ncbi:MAG: electron transport complex subunit RsxG [Candidatus Thiodiazotropha sp.]